MRVWALYSSGDGYCDCGRGDESLIRVTADEAEAIAWEAVGNWQTADETELSGMK